jgi:predicted esterase YcpF (UPF0227 family)
MTSKPIILYLHGFLSSPQSAKAQRTRRYCEQQGLGEQVLIPHMGHGPAQTIAELRSIIDSQGSRNIVLIGSSLGGFYATYLAEEYGFPAALINPAVKPFERWEEHLGEHQNYYSGEIHIVTQEHVDELRHLDKSPLQYPDNFMLLVQTGDEVLDYRQAVEKFSSSACIVRENGSHKYENFVDELPVIFEFLWSRIDEFAR